MRILFSFLAVCILFTVSPLFAMADSKPLDWQMRYGDEGNMNYSPVSLPLNLVLKQDPINNASAMFAVNQGQLYSTDRIENKKLSAIDLATNKVKWLFSTEGNDKFLDLIVKDGIIYASTMNKLYAIEDSGSAPVIKWSKDTLPAGRLTFDSSTLFYKDSDNKIFALDLKTGAEKWALALKPNEHIDGKFAVGGNRLYFTVKNPVKMYFQLYALDSATGQVLWTVDLGSSGISSSQIPVYKDEKVYIDRHDISKSTIPGSITAFNAAAGNVLWQYGVKTDFEKPLSINGNSVIALDMDGNMMAVDKNTGTEKWKVVYTDVDDHSNVVKGSQSIILTSDKIVVENNNKLKFYNPIDGSQLNATLPLTINSNVMGLYPIGVIENTIFLTDSNNLLYTFGLEVKDTVVPSGTFNLAPLSYLPPPDGSSRIRIPFTLSEDAFVKLSLVDEAGKVVQQFDLGRCKVGANEISWDGKNVRGYTYAQGKYYPVLELTDLSGNKATYKAQDKIILITDNYGLTTRSANLRKSAGTMSEIIRVVPSGSEVKIIGESGNWYQVEYRMLSNVQSGFISKPLIAALTNSQISQDQTGITRQSVNVRTFSGTQYNVKTVIPANTNIKIVCSSGDWYIVEYQNSSNLSDQGYVAKYLISVTTNNKVHVVQAGDTLWKIAQKYGTTVNMIIKLNNLDTTKYLYVGQKLTVSS